MYINELGFFSCKKGARSCKTGVTWTVCIKLSVWSPPTVYIKLSVWSPPTHLQLDEPQQVFFGCLEDGTHFTGGDIRAPPTVCVMIYCRWSLMHGHGLL